MTLTLTSDDLENHIVVNVSSTLTNTTIWFVAALFDCGRIRIYVRMGGRNMTDGHFYRVISLLGHLRRSPKN